MSKKVYNKDILQKLEEIENKIIRIEKIVDRGSLDAIFYGGIAFILAGITLSFTEQLKDSYVPMAFMIFGVIVVIITNYVTEMKKK